MQLIQISAWNDSGGGFLNRLLDGHPQLVSWPYELLLGNDTVEVDRFSPNWFRARFRWPRLDDVSRQEGGALFDAIADSELKSVLKDPAASKHRDFPVAVDMAEWRERVAAGWEKAERRDQASFLRLYIDSFLALWRGKGLAGSERLLGHCPIAILDADELWRDFADARIVHVIRQPAPGYHDMRSRHSDLQPGRYAAKWSLINEYAAVLAGKYPRKVRLVALRDLLSERERTMTALCRWLGLEFSEKVLAPTWCGRPIDPMAMGPFGGVPQAAPGREMELRNGIPAGDERVICEITAATRSMLEDVHGLRL